jgi:[protein-PII] uridylyltransferase
VVNIFRVCTTNFEAISSTATRKRFLETFESILSAADYEPERYLKRRVNFLKPRTDQGIPVPVQAYVSNELHPACTTVELQALDRIGLLHDLFHTVNQYGLNTAHARICTEKGVAMDTLYITTADGGKVEDPEILKQLEERFTALIARPEAAE